MIILYLVLGIVLSLVIAPRLTAGAPVTITVKQELLSREMQPVVSQTGAKIPAIEQMLPVDPESVPGNKDPIWPAENLHFFDGTDIVPKLCGPGITAGVLNNWKNVEQNWQEEYSANRLNTDMSRVRPVSYSGLRASAKQVGINPKYFHNPAGFCKVNPESPPCPNNWIDGPTQEPPSSGNMWIPGMCRSVVV